MARCLVGLVLFMLYLALSTYKWQLCSTSHKFTSCASAVSAITQQHVLCKPEIKLINKRIVYMQKAISCAFRPGSTATEMAVKEAEEKNSHQIYQTCRATGYKKKS